MSDHLLTVDLGNSRCKLRLWSAVGELLLAATFEAGREHAEQLSNQCGRWLAEAPHAAHAALASVSSPELELALRAQLEPQIGDGQLRMPEPGLELDLRSSHTLGRDRLFAARGAFGLVRESALVLGAGTALTVDVLVMRNARPVFCGGAITAGPHLIARALREHTARLPEFDLQPGVSALGCDTGSALAAGTVLGFRGAARQLVEALSSECHLAAAPLVISGGARRFLLEPEPFVARRLVESEDLVHLGLLAALHDDLERIGERP